MKKLIPVLLCTLLGSHLIAQKTRYNLMFNKGQTELTSKQKEEILNMTNWIKPTETVSIFPLTYDERLDRLFFPKNAKEQAGWIAAYAKSLGFKVTGIARNFPTAYKGLSATVNVTYNLPKPKNELSALFPEKPSQFFVIDPTKDTLIVGNEGTKLLFEGGSLMTSHPVKVELKEFYALADLIKNGLSTSSNGKLIETGGSIYLDATENNRPEKKVKINPNKGVAVDFTIGKNDPEMEIFIKDSRYPNQLNWVLPKAKRTSSVRERWTMTETIYNADMTVISEQVFHSKAEWQAHLQQRKEAEEQKQKEEAIKQATANKMDSKLKVYDLGYINCDKFYDEPMTPYVVAADKKTVAEYYLVFNEVRGVMKGHLSNQQVHFGSVPKNKTAKLVAVSYIDQQAYYFDCSVKAGSSPLPEIQLKPVEDRFVNQQLALLKQ